MQLPKLALHIETCSTATAPGVKRPVLFLQLPADLLLDSAVSIAGHLLLLCTE